MITLPAFPALAAALGQLSFAVWGALGFLAVFCTLIGFAVWFWALEHGGVTSIAPLQFGQPLVSLVIAVAFLSEDIFPVTLLALSLVILGVHLSRRAA
ncbi:DMT family transporter [Bradyrhizobium sp. CCBAU 21362]|uniref:DMT family transporter n=1 Tax=Bradyrhizobium sp. CCBAU 21362 TaxID=1325082 RepID=UPI0023056A1F|nr:DMT family transporter [Bradyrhizobium sp. CCBAU 21362]